jgi:hypothetical protein
MLEPRKLKLSTKQILLLAEAYVNALAGNEVIVALRNHVAMAEVTVKFVQFNEPERTVIKNIFEAAQGQNKLIHLLEVIRNDGFEIQLGDIIGPVTDKDDDNAETNMKAELDSLFNWITSESEYIDIRGIGETKANQAIVFPILKLYTELFVETGLTNLDLNQGRLKGQARIPLTQMVDSTRCLIIMGDPGAGNIALVHSIS